MVMLGVIFYTSKSEHPIFKKFYGLVPMLLLCYFAPSLLTFFRLVDPNETQTYFVASRYLLPASLVLLTVSIDLREIVRLGPKALIMFFTGTVGVVLGGPIAVWLTALVNPELVGGVGPTEVWRGLATVAGSWIGGGANQAAMAVIYEPTDELFSVMVAVDVIVAEAWMLFLLLGVGKAEKIDAFFKADASAIDRLRDKMETFAKKTSRIPTSVDLMMIGAIGFGAVAASHWAADIIAPWFKGVADSLKSPDQKVHFLEAIGLTSGFFWLIVAATTIGVVLSFTRARNYEGAGASKVGTVFIFILVATIGLKMDIRAVVEHPGLFLVGGIWMVFHVALLFLVGWLIRAPYFFLAVGSKANIGGAASAPVVAAAFHPALAPVGVLLAVLGYALGTYAAVLCAGLMRAASPIAGG
ncbi:membrane protein [Acidobacteria bacterium Mor1]|nr:membrane protein [Acidobacteria bacterium Mor1]